ncbi:hypothetical protein DFQ27_009184 [Actinomortierella ambigua]|uniref:DUF455 family protein n=1 Tax=Actinomortierella ambigua TaxID=1343610 RepID=A0A9P6QET5_9FUNG|nr:hypothetical protein DFQ27_009184 [Actinomortierella ambigua]
MNTVDPIDKANLTLLLGEDWRRSRSMDANPRPGMMEIGRAIAPEKPVRPDNLDIVRPGHGVRVGRAGSIALANVETWAIDVSVCNIAAYGYYTLTSSGTKVDPDASGEQLAKEYRMPIRFFDDFIQMACDEAKHFKWFYYRLEDLGAHYGDLPVHASIWDSVLDTAHSMLARMAVVHMVHEARGLDVNPSTIARFDKSGDVVSARMLELVHADEVVHVQIGHRWFCYLLMKHEGIGKLAQDIDEDGNGELYEFRQVAQPPVNDDGTEAQVDPVEAQRRKRFQEIVVQFFKGALKPPFNTLDRSKGGMTRGWYEPLVVVRERTGFRPVTGRRHAVKDKDKSKSVDATEKPKPTPSMTLKDLAEALPQAPGDAEDFK